MWVEKNGPTYRIRDLVAGKKVDLRTGIPNKTTANRLMVGLKADKYRGDGLVPRAGEMTVGDWLDEWWPSYSASLKPSARISAEGILRNHVRPGLGAIALEEVDRLTVQRWTSGLVGVKTGTPLSPKAIRNIHGLAHKVFAEAVAQRYIRANPCTRTGLPEKVPYEARFLTHQEADRLLAAMPEHWRPLVALFLGTGLRWSEAVGLKGGRLDVLGRRLTVIEQMQELAGSGELVFVTPKSRRSRRTVTFTTALAEVLVPLAGVGRDELVFRTPLGHPVRGTNFRRVWKRATAAAGLDGLRPHDCRHTHAAWLLSAGMPITAVSRRLGHASVMVTTEIYGHLLTEADDAILETLDAAMPMIDFRGQVGESTPEQPGATLHAPEQRAGQAASRTL